MKKLIVIPVGLALLTAACGETRTQKASTGAAGGLVAGAVLGGPVGALAGAGLGAAGGAYQDEIEPHADATVDRAFRKARAELNEDAPDRPSGATAAAAPADRAMVSDRRAGRDDLTNDEVREAQNALRDMGLYEGEIDGLYGWQTIGAVKQFQAREDMPRSGMLSERTQQALQRVASNESAGGGQAAEGRNATGTDSAPGAPQQGADREQQGQTARDTQ